MITAEQLTTMSTFTAAALTRAVGSTDYIYAGSKFLGLTNGGEFCYLVLDTEGAYSKVFLKFDPTADRVIATVG
jgi:hypothetical protein